MRRALRRTRVLAALALAGCALARPPRPAVEGVSAEQLLAGLAARREAITSLRARARLKTGLAGMWTREAVLVQRPNAVRVDVLSPFGLALALGTRGDVLWAYPPAENVRYEGEASPLNLARFLGAPVTTSDLVDIMLGLPPARVSTATPTLERSAGAGWVLTLPFDGGMQRLWFDAGTLELERAEEHRGDALTLTVGFDDYREGFPHTLDVTAPLVGSSARLTYDEVERNPILDAALFAPPSTPRVLPLEAAAASG